MDPKIETLVAVTNRIKTPLALSALIVIVLYGIYWQVLSLDVFEKIGSDPTFLLLQNALNKVFWLALFALILGVASYLVTVILGHRIPPHNSKVQIIDASLDTTKSPFYEENEEDGRTKIRPRLR
jgi:hypothetical protein